MDARMQKHRMTRWLGRLLALLSLAKSCRVRPAELLGSSSKGRSEDSNNRVAPGYLVRALVGLLLSSVSAQVSADWDAGAAGCFASFQTAMAKVCAINNPDSTSIPGSVYYRDSCVMTSIPNFRVYAHAVNLATGNSFSFTYTLSLTQCDFTISLSGGTEVEPSTDSADNTLPFIATVKNRSNGLPPTNPVEVKISLKVEPTSGGHDHGTSDRPRGGIADVETCLSDDKCWSHATDNGAVVFNFNPPDASGTHTITATCDGCSNTATKSVDVKVGDLWPIFASTYYALIEDGSSKIIGSTPEHSSNHYVASEAQVQLWKLATDFYNYQLRNGVTNPTLLHLNDASLKWGGKFDIHGTWHGQHDEHRRGTVIDVRANSTSGAIPPALFENYIDMATKLGIDPHLEYIGDPIRQHFHTRLLNREE